MCTLQAATLPKPQYIFKKILFKNRNIVIIADNFNVYVGK